MRRRFIRNREAVDEYFTIESLEDECVISLTDRAGISEGIGGVVWYSINNSHWTWDNLSKNPITLKKGYKVRFKNNTSMGTFVITKKCKILGSIMSLCFMDDFKNKTSLESHKFPELFKGCNTIVSVDKGFLPATTLSDSCYRDMFYGCTNLVEAPVLPATILTYQCYFQMFHGCTKLNYIKMLATDIPSGDRLNGWVYGVSPTGTFVKSKDATWDTTPGALGDGGVPAGWTVKNDGEEEGGKIINTGRIKPTLMKTAYINWDFPVASNVSVIFHTEMSAYEISTNTGTNKSGGLTLGPGESELIVDYIEPIEDDTYIYEVIVEE